jgi:hypothetical protein
MASAHRPRIDFADAELELLVERVVDRLPQLAQFADDSAFWGEQIAGGVATTDDVVRKLDAWMPTTP